MLTWPLPSSSTVPSCRRLCFGVLALMTLSACDAELRNDSHLAGESCYLGRCYDLAPAALERCCKDTYGRGLSTEDAATLPLECRDTTCRADSFISSAAAVCIAEGVGVTLPPDECAARFEQVGERWRYLVWGIDNVVCNAEGTGHEYGTLCDIDARDGEVMGMAATVSLISGCDQ